MTTFSCIKMAWVAIGAFFLMTVSAKAAMDWQPVDGIPGNLLINSGAEEEPLGSGWTVDGFSIVEYGTSAKVPDAAYAQPRNLGRKLFVAERAGATLTQDVQIANLANIPNSDEVGQNWAWLQAGALLGEATGSGDLPTLSAEVLDVDGKSLGEPISAIPARVTQLQDPCICYPSQWQVGGITQYAVALGTLTSGMLARGAHRVRIRLTASGPTGIADILYLTPEVGYGSIPAVSCCPGPWYEVSPSQQEQPPPISVVDSTLRPRAPSGARPTVKITYRLNGRRLVVRLLTSTKVTGKVRLAVQRREGKKIGTDVSVCTRTVRFRKGSAQSTCTLPRKPGRLRVIARYAGDANYAARTFSKAIGK